MRRTGRAWEIQTGAAVWNTPALHDGVVYIGRPEWTNLRRGRQQRRHPLDRADGGCRFGDPAVDSKLNRVYVGSEDMRVYAFDLKDGQMIWRSGTLPGVSLRGYHPVVAPDGSVLVTTAPGLPVDLFQDLLLRMTKEIFGDFASWRHSKEANDVLREENFALMDKPETYARQLDFIRQHLADEPAFQTFFVLDPATGQRKFVAPIVYSESMNGPGAPAVISRDGKVFVKFQALLRSRYEHYSPFLNIGELDTSTGDIRPVMDQSRIYGWFDSLLLVHDEQCQLALSGGVLINTHQDNVNGLDLKTLEGFLEPFCRNVHEPKPGEALAIWTRLLHDQPLPVGKEWLSRGTAVYGGGSVLDTSVAIAGDSFYYLPTHELNAGAALIAYRMNASGSAGKETNLVPEPVGAEDWRKIEQLPWDWDTLENRRLASVLEALPGKVPGTRQLPLTNNASPTLDDAELERILWEAPGARLRAAPGVYLAGLEADLAAAVEELISREWQPLVFPSGKFPEEAYRFFTEPTETLYTLALAYPHLSPALKLRVQNFVTGLCARPPRRHTGQRTYAPDKGEIRSAYTPPARRLSFRTIFSGPTWRVCIRSGFGPVSPKTGARWKPTGRGSAQCCNNGPIGLKKTVETATSQG